MEQPVSKKIVQISMLIVMLLFSVGGLLCVACLYLTDGSGMTVILGFIFPVCLFITTVCLLAVRSVQKKQYQHIVTQIEGLICLLVMPVVLMISIGISNALVTAGKPFHGSGIVGYSMLILAILQFVLMVRSLVQVWRYQPGQTENVPILEKQSTVKSILQTALLSFAMLCSVGAALSIACLHLNLFQRIGIEWSAVDSILIFVVFPGGMLVAVVCLVLLRGMQGERPHALAGGSLFCVLETFLAFYIFTGIGSWVQMEVDFMKNDLENNIVGVPMLLLAVLLLALLIRDIVKVWRKPSVESVPWVERPKYKKTAQTLLLLQAILVGVTATVCVACLFMYARWDLPGIFDWDESNVMILLYFVFAPGLLLSVSSLTAARKLQGGKTVICRESMICMLVTPIVLGIAIWISSAFNHTAQDNKSDLVVGVAMLFMASLQFLLIVRNIVQVWRDQEEA